MVTSYQIKDAQIQLFREEICNYRRQGLSNLSITKRLDRRDGTGIKIGRYKLRAWLLIWDPALVGHQPPPPKLPSPPGATTERTSGTSALKRKRRGSKSSKQTNAEDPHVAKTSRSQLGFNKTEDNDDHVQNKKRVRRGKKRDSKVLKTLSDFWNPEIEIPRPLRPSQHPEWQSARSNLSAYYEIRRHLQETQRRCRRLYDELLKFRLSSSTSDLEQTVLRKLYLLQEARNECDELLANTQLETDLISGIQRLTTGQEDVGQQAHSGHSQTPEDESPDKSKALPRMAIKQLDHELTSHCSALLGSINTSRFKASLAEFEGIRTRHPFLSASSAHPSYLFREARDRSLFRAEFLPSKVLLHDNLYHAIQLFGELGERALEGADLKRADQIWRHLIATVAISNGCISDPAFFLSTMDRLLSQLKSAFGMAPDHTYQRTIKRSQAFGVVGFELCDAPDCNSTPPYSYRQLFAEFALFVHGSVVAAISSSWKLIGSSGFIFGPNQKYEPGEEMLAKLLACNEHCCICGEAMSIVYGKKQSEGRHSIGMRDKRLGDFLTRSVVSTDRDSVYPCFSGFDRGCMSAGKEDLVAPFFFYFGEISHAGCRLFREKETMLSFPKE